MSSDWPTVTLADIAQLSMGETILSKNLTGDGIPVFSANTDEGPWGYTSNSRRRLRRGDIVIGARGSIGFPRRPDFDAFICTQTTIAVQPDRDAVDSEYLHHALCATDILGIASQQAVPMLTIGSLAPLEIVLPPLDEQRRIAEVLRSVDEAIAAADVVVTQAAEAFEALLADLFSRYGDASARLESYCLAGGLQTGPFGSQLKAEDYVEDGVPIIMPVDLTPEGMDFVGAKKAPAAKSKELARHILQPGDVLFARRGEIGRCGLYLEGDPVALCGTGCLRARLDTTKIDPALAYFLIQSRQARDWLCAHAVGATMPNLNTTIIGQLPMPYIPKDEQGAWVDAMLMIEGTRRINQQTLASFQQTKSTLMSDLLSGRVRVPA